MTEDAVTGSLHLHGGTGTVRQTARLAHDAATVWAALTDPAQLAAWLGEIGGRHAVGEELPAVFAATGWEGSLRVETCVPRAHLVLRTRSEGEPDCTMDLTLTPEGDRTVLVLEDRGLPVAPLAAYGAGDQVLVEDLVAHLAGRGRCAARERWLALHPAYQELAAGLVAQPADA